VLLYEGGVIISSIFAKTSFRNPDGDKVTVVEA
jgi:hypothetical protein